MKQIVCEMCGSTDLIKDEGVFMCQSCGMKYSLQEARKLMIEGIVDVRGTVQIDNTDFVEKCLANAVNAKERGDWQEAVKFYNLVKENDPDNAEAVFNSVYGRAMHSLSVEDLNERKSIFNVLNNCLVDFSRNYDVNKTEDNRKSIISMAEDLGRMINSDFVYTERRNDNGFVIGNNSYETYKLFEMLVLRFKKSIDEIKEIDEQPFLYEAIINLFTFSRQVDWPSKDSLYYRMNTRMPARIKKNQASLEALNDKRFSLYWEQHADQKKEYENRIASLEAEHKTLHREMQNLPVSQRLNKLRYEMADLTGKRDKLGIFKQKERRVIKDQIDELSKLVDIAVATHAKETAPMEEELKRITADIEAIKLELTRRR